MAFAQVEVLEVRAWGQRLGALSAGRGGVAAFEYDQAWQGGELSPILMPLTPPSQGVELPHSLP